MVEHRFSHFEIAGHYGFWNNIFIKLIQKTLWYYTILYGENFYIVESAFFFTVTSIRFTDYDFGIMDFTLFWWSILQLVLLLLLVITIITILWLLLLAFFSVIIIILLALFIYLFIYLLTCFILFSMLLLMSVYHQSLL